MQSPLPKDTNVSIIKPGSEYNGMKGVTISGVYGDGKYLVEVLETNVRPNPMVEFLRSEIHTPEELQTQFEAVKAKATGKGGRKSRKSKKRITRKKRSTRRR